MLRHRRLVAVFWLAMTIAGVLLAGQITGRFSSAQELPGLPSYRAAEVLQHSYGIGDNPPGAILVTLRAGEQITSAAGRSDLGRALGPVSADHSLHLVSYLSARNHKLVSGNGRSTLVLVYGGAKQPTSAGLASQMRSSVPPGVTVHATSLNDLASGGSSGGIGVLGEGVIAGLGALLVLAVVFGPLLALVPLIIAVVAILTTFLLIGLVSTVAPVSSLVEFLIALVGLGVAIDYSLLMISRWREERARGLGNQDAIARAMSTAGRSIAFSALVVAIGLLSLVLLPIPFLRSLGYAGLFIPLVSAVVALTLLPVILAGPGRRLGNAHRRRTAGPGRRWHSWASLVVRHRLLAAAAGLAILGTLLGFATRLSVGEPQPGSQATAGAAHDGLVALRQAGFPDGVLAPVDIVAPDAAVSVLNSRLTALPGVYATLVAPDPRWRHAGTTVIQVLPAGPTSSAAGKTAVASVRSLTERTSPRALVTGDGPFEADVVSALYSRFPAILGLVAALSLLLLMRAFRSVVLPVKALVLNVLSIGASYGALVLIWQYGYGSKAIWGIPATGVIVEFVPLLVFAFQFGLSMDYEVFIVSRIREEYDTGLSTDNAAVAGIARTGRLVTSAALILFLAFAALAAGPQTSIKIFATGLGVGILLDATVVRALLLPALISLFGRWNWWLPRPVARIVRWPSGPGGGGERSGIADDAALGSGSRSR
ncbi:MAG TPA: MMPL family transporter [Streptosporangiaceae bacterium]|nr:MMPL family transporter [Streptosporangiaceae bacterium]